MSSKRKPAQEQPDLHDRASALSLKLEALLSVTSGSQGAEFRTLSDELQDNFMWACSDMATELRECIGKLR